MPEGDLHLYYQRQLQEFIDAGRRERLVAYLFLTLAGVAALLAPSVVLLEQANTVISRTCGVIWSIFSLLCLIDTYRKRWVVEYVCIPLLSLTLIVFACALGAEALKTWDAPRTLSYFFFFCGFASLLAYRHSKVRVLLKAHRSREEPAA